MSISGDKMDAEQSKAGTSPEVEAHIRKAREAALLGLQLYNTPLTAFKTEGYSVMMVIAWTALFHAIFEKRKTPYFYIDKATGTPIVIDGDEKAWELGECIKQYYVSECSAARANLDFFVRLRNKIEHRYVPAIDPEVAGECQALLLNFDELLTLEFGSEHAIRESLAVPLQTSTVRTSGQTTALKRLQSKHFDEVKKFVDAYRDGLPASVYENQSYSFRVFLVAKTGNHASSADRSIEFVRYDPSRSEEMTRIQKDIALIKEKHVQVSNANLLSPKQVSRQVALRIGRQFTTNRHRCAWGMYKVRAPGFDPGACDTRYCVADPRHKDYGFTLAWVEFLVQKLSNENEYQTVLNWKPKE